MVSKSTIFKNLNLQHAAVATLLVVVVLLAIFISNVFNIAYYLTVYFLPVIAIASAIITIRVWASLKDNKQAAKILQGFGISLALWALAELTWMIYLMLEIEPYPSIADIFWVLGYLFIFRSLQQNIRLTNVRLEQEEQVILIIIAIIGLLVTIFTILIPIIRDFSLDRVFEGFFNLAYPIFDLILILQLGITLFMIQKSLFRVSWVIILLSYFIVSIADLGFTYGYWNDLYLYEGTNLFTRMIDWGYMAFYPVFTLGVYMHFRNQEAEIKLEEPSHANLTLPAILANTCYLVYSDSHENVIDFSKNIYQIRPNADKLSLSAFMAAFVGNSTDDTTKMIQDIGAQIISNGFIKDYPLQIDLPNGKSCPGWLSGIGIFSSGNTFNGMNLLLRTYQPGIEPYAGLTDSDRGIAHYISTQCSVEEFPILDSLIYFTQQYFVMVSKLLTVLSGELVAQNLWSELDRTITNKDWPAKLEAGIIKFPSQMKFADTIGILAHLLEQAGEYTKRYISHETYQETKQEWLGALDPTIAQLSKDYGIRLS